MMFYILYIIFFVSSLLYGNFYIGPATPRQMMTVIMFTYLLCNRKLFYDGIMKLYTGFVAFYLLSGALSGYFAESTRFVFSYFFVAYVGYVATALLLSHKRGYSVLIYSIIVLGLINSVATVSQIFHIDVVENLLRQIHLADGIETLMDKGSSYSDADSDTLLFALPGIFQKPVENGYFSAAAAITAMYVPLKHNRLLSYLPWLLLMVGCFATQQRTAFVGAVVCSCYLFYHNIRYSEIKGLSRYLPFIPIIALATYVSTHNFSFTTRYDEMLDMTSRTHLYIDSLEFIKDNFFFGGIFLFNETYYVYPHNLIFNAFIAGGAFGAVFIFIILFKQLRMIYDLYLKSRITPSLIVPLLVIMSMLGNSLMHNQSLVYGDFIYWIFCAFLIMKPVS